MKILNISDNGRARRIGRVPSRVFEALKGIHDDEGDAVSYSLRRLVIDKRVAQFALWEVIALNAITIKYTFQSRWDEEDAAGVDVDPDQPYIMPLVVQGDENEEPVQIFVSLISAYLNDDVEALKLIIGGIDDAYAFVEVLLVALTSLLSLLFEGGYRWNEDEIRSWIWEAHLRLL